MIFLLSYSQLRDPRQPATPLRAHTSTHSDDITTLSFAPSRDPETNCNIILSGSTDGLLSTSNADEDDEDEAVIQVGNWGCSIAQAGWIHNDDPQKASIWAGGDMETFSTWKSDVCGILISFWLSKKIETRNNISSWTNC
jgi:hypothetical protein